MTRERKVRRKSGFGPEPKLNESLGFAPLPLGQRYPQQYPQRCPYPEGPQGGASPEPLGAPLSIREAARIIGCSPWTVRQTLMPRGLPYFRSGGGRLIFYTNQIIGWIENQQKGDL